MKKLIILVLMLTLAANALAEIKFSADARVRPRMDITGYYDSADEYLYGSADMYWLYRARLTASAELDGGFMWTAKLGHEAVAMWSKMGTSGTNQMDWMLAYFGQKTDRYSWYLGRVPMAGNLLTDLHYSPTFPLGIPFVLYNNLATTGIKGSVNAGPGTLDLFYSIEENNQALEVDSDNKTTYTDQNTVGGGYTFAIAGTKVAAQLLYTMGDDAFINPMTYGFMAYPSFAGFNLAGGLAMTSEADDAYTGMTYHAGVKKALGPGALSFWYRGGSLDFSDHTFVAYDGTPILYDEATYAYTYLWLTYGFNYGPVKFMPTWRHMKTLNPDDTYMVRDFFELTMEIKVK